MTGVRRSRRILKNTSADLTLRNAIGEKQCPPLCAVEEGGTRKENKGEDEEKLRTIQGC